ncbi:hypothetical protein H4219_001968 [Mycoemilia scoparia]|uniref:Nudix hydrolase domain-containing protein n=1 Tax=Mycoemilia scoparia TaxID=417184 RepID=A0A9W8A6Y7_9FUNG|nr:hypothetical protein H4219_001968 [Mycoemilia scoparia]
MFHLHGHSLIRQSSSLIITVPTQQYTRGSGSSSSSSNNLPKYNYRLLMLKRGSFKGALVFPGGNVDDGIDRSERWEQLARDPSSGALSDHNKDMLAYKICAIRETFEETNLPLFSPYQKAIQVTNNQDRTSTSFLDLCNTHDLRPLTGLIYPHSHWVTPTQMPRRFNTQFFICHLGKIAEKFSPSPDKQKETLASLVDRLQVQENEIVKSMWLTPSEALDACSRREITLFPPQFYILNELSKYNDWKELQKLNEQHRSCEYWHRDPTMPILPEIRVKPDDPERVVMLLPGDKEYPMDDITDNAFFACSGQSNRIDMKRRDGGMMGFEDYKLISSWLEPHLSKL